jgi:hypothetical protein
MVVFASIVAIGIMLFVWQWSTTYTAQIDIGHYDTVWLDGFYGVEAQPNSHRWSSAHATVRFPTINHGWNVGILDLQNGHPTEQSNAEVAVITGANQQIRFVVAFPQIRHYMFLLPPTATPQWYSAVTLTIQTIKTTTDPRMLGVVLTAITATPTLLHSGLPYVVLMWY